MLGEASTAELERAKNPEKFKEHFLVSKEGGTIAKNAREDLESKTGKSIISNENYLSVPEKEFREKKEKEPVYKEFKC
jgi:hypothetical protein